MRIIVEGPQDPTDYVLQGAVIGDRLLGGEPNSRLPWFVLQGEIKTAAIAETSIPSAMIGQHDWYGIKPRTVGPMRVGGGEIVMLDIGQKPVDVFVDPTQRWQASVFQIDKTGFMMTLYDPKTIGVPEAFAQFMVPEPETMGNPVITIPRGAVYRSGLIKRTTVPVLPDSFGRHTVVDDFTETTHRWFIIGVTKDGTGVALGSCRVVMMKSGKFLISPDILANPITIDTTSGVDGTFSIQVPNEKAVQILASKLVPPYVAGLTVDTIVPSDSIVSIYLYDPTALAGGSGGLAAGSILFNVESGEPYIYIGDPLILKV
jgi:hypothetical protein